MTSPAGSQQPAFRLPDEIMILIWQEIAKYLTDDRLYNFQFDIVRKPLGLMACFTPVNIATQTRDLISLLMVNKSLRKWAIRALGGKLLPINYITTVPCPQTRRRKVLRQGLVPFNLQTSLFCITKLSQNFELWFRGCGSTDKPSTYPWTRQHVITYLTGFEELAPLVKNLVFPVQKDRWKFSTLYQQHWTKLIGPAGGALPIAFAQRFPHLEKVGMMNERKVWNDCEAPTRELCLVKTLNRMERSVILADMKHFCFTLWIEWWAWDAGFRLASDPTEDLDAAICQLLGRSKPPSNDLSDGS